MKNIVVFTGAGISAESGLGTFRDSGGLWENYKIEDVATPEAFQNNPSLVLDFYNTRRMQLLNASPNNAHISLSSFGTVPEYGTPSTSNISNVLVIIYAIIRLAEA